MGSCFSSYETVATVRLECAISNEENHTIVDDHLRRAKNINEALPISKLTPLELAITKQNASIVELVLDRGADTEQRSNAEWTPLLRACRLGCLNVVRLLVKRGADFTVRSPDGFTCLYLAAKNGNHSVVSYLLGQESFTVDDVDAEGYTLLHHVVMFNDPDATSLLINKGLDVAAKTRNGETPLFLAAKHNCAESMRVLIDSGADPTICTKDGESLLCAAARQENVQATDLLLTIGADTEQKLSDGWTPLLRVCSTGCLEAVKSLVESGADIQARTPSGLSCLSVAAENKHRSVVSYLLKQKFCSVDDVDVAGYTLLHHVVMFNDPVATSTLISKGLDIDAKTQDRETPVFLAIKHNCLASFKVLLNSKADLNIKTKNGDFALKEAVNQGRVDLVTLLLEHGADNTPFIQDGHSPIDLAKEIDIARQQRNNPTSSVAYDLQQEDNPSALDMTKGVTELASNVVGIVKAVLGG